MKSYGSVRIQSRRFVRECRCGTTYIRVQPPKIPDWGGGHTVYILVHATQRELCEVVIERNIFPVNFPAFAVYCKLVVVFILVALGATCCQTLELLQGAPVGKGLKMTGTTTLFLVFALKLIAGLAVVEMNFIPTVFIMTVFAGSSRTRTRGKHGSRAG